MHRLHLRMCASSEKLWVNERSTESNMAAEGLRDTIACKEEAEEALQVVQELQLSIKSKLDFAMQLCGKKRGYLSRKSLQRDQ